MSRTANIKKNLIFNIIKFATQMVLQFVLRTALIYILGAEYLGLNGLFTNIFSFLNLAELGIGSAIVFSMYKPIAEGDTEKVKALQNLYKRFYFIIAIIVLAAGVLILPFLKFFINGEVSVDINIYLLYLLYLINTLVGYFSAHKRSLLFAYQRNDIENKLKTICLFTMSVIQIAVLFIFKNYYIYFTVNIIFTILECVLIYVWANKLLPEINGKTQELDKDTKKDIFKNVGALSLHKIGSAIVFSTDNILISSMLGLTVLGAYSNYYLIITTITGIFTLIANALTGSVGNLIASNDTEYVYQKYKQINFIFAILSAFTTVCMAVLFQPFIKVWTGGGIYILNYSTVVLLCVSFYLSKMRTSTCMFKECAGLFNQDKWKALVEAVINLTLSIVLGVFMGLNGIILGTIISTIVAPLWVEPWVLYKHYFKRSVKDYFRTYLRDGLITLIVGAVCFGVCWFMPSSGVWWLIGKFAVCVVLCAGMLILAYLPTKEFKENWQLFKGLLTARKNKKSG